MFEYNGFEFTYEEVEAKAKEKGLDIDTYIKQYGINKIDAPSEEGKTTSQGQGAPVAGTAAPENQQANTESSLEDGSSVFQNSFVEIDGQERSLVTASRLNALPQNEEELRNKTIIKIDGTPYSIKEIENTAKQYNLTLNQYINSLQRDRSRTEETAGMKSRVEIIYPEVVEKLDEAVVSPSIYAEREGLAPNVKKVSNKKLFDGITEKSKIHTPEEVTEEAADVYFGIGKIEEEYKKDFQKKILLTSNGPVPGVDMDLNKDEFYKKALGSKYEDYQQYIKTGDFQLDNPSVKSQIEAVAEKNLQERKLRNAIDDLPEGQQNDLKIFNKNFDFETPAQAKQYAETIKGDIEENIKYLDNKIEQVNKTASPFVNEFNKISKTLEDLNGQILKNPGDPALIQAFNAELEKYNQLLANNTDVIRDLSAIENMVAAHEEEIDDYYNKMSKLSDEASINKMLDYDYRKLSRVAQASSDFAVKGGLGTLKLATDILDFENAPEESPLKKLSDNLSEALTGLEEERKNIPAALEFKDQKFGASFSDVLLELAADNAPSTILSAVGGFGAMAKGANFLGRMGVGVANLSKSTIPTFFISSTGTKYSDLKSAQKNVPAVINYLNEELKNPSLTDFEKKQIQKELNYQEELEDFGLIRTGGSAVLYGAMEAGWEMFGNKLIGKSAQRFLTGAGKKTLLSKRVAGGAGYLVGQVIEQGEEVGTQFTQNYIDIVGLKEDKSLLDGFTPEFFASTAFSSLLGSGGAQSVMTINGLSNLAKTSKDRAEFKTLFKEIKNLEVQGLNNKDFKIERAKLVKKANILSQYLVSNLDNFSSEDLKALGEIDRKERKAVLEIIELADNPNFELGDNQTRTRLTNISNKRSDYQKQRDAIVKANKKASVPDEMETEKSIFLYKKYINNLALSKISGVKVAELEDGIDFDSMNELNPLTEKGIAKLRKLDIFQNKSEEEIVKDMGSFLGDNAQIFEDNKSIVVNRSAAMSLIANAETNEFSASRAALAPLHEVLHAYTASKKFKLNNENFQKATTELKDILTNKFKNEEINKAVYESAMADLSTYKNKEDYIKNEEFMNLYWELHKSGYIKESDLEKIGGDIGNYINKIRKQAFGILGLNASNTDTFSNAQDIISHLESFNDFLSKRKQIKFIDGINEEIKKASSSEASEKVQKIFDEQGIAGVYEIMDEYKPMANKIAQRYRDRPGFTTYKEDLVTGILDDPTYGVMGLVLKYNPSENKGVPLAAYINKYLAARSITLANELLGKDEGSTFKSDVTEVKDIAATETSEDAILASEEIAKEKPVKKKTVFSDEIKFDEELSPEFDKTLVKAIALNIKKFDIEVGKNRTITPFVADLKKDIADFAEKDVVKFIKRQGLEDFLIKNRELILNNYTTTFLSKHPFFRKGILKQVNGEWVAPTRLSAYKYDWVDKNGDKLKIDRDNAAGRGMTSGPEIMKRNPKIIDIIKENEFVDYHFQDGALRNKPKQNPVNSLGRQLASEMGFEIIQRDIDNSGELSKTISERAELLLAMSADEVSSKIGKLKVDFTRGLAKSQFSFDKYNKKHADRMAEYGDKIAAFLTKAIVDGRPTKKSIWIDVFGQEDIEENFKKDTIALAKEGRKVIIQERLNKKYKIKIEDVQSFLNKNFIEPLTALDITKMVNLQDDALSAKNPAAVTSIENHIAYYADYYIETKLAEKEVITKEDYAEAALASAKNMGKGAGSGANTYLKNTKGVYDAMAVFLSDNGFNIETDTDLSFKPEGNRGFIIKNGKKESLGIFAYAPWVASSEDIFIKDNIIDLKKLNIKERNDQSKAAFDMVTDLIEYSKWGFNNGLLSPFDIAVLWNSQTKHMTTPLKMSYYLKYFTYLKGNTGKKFVYEHLLPVNILVKAIIGNVLKYPGFTDELISKMRETAYASITQKDFDNVLTLKKHNVNLQSSMPAGFVFGSFDNLLRYFNEATKREAPELVVQDLESSKIITHENYKPVSSKSSKSSNTIFNEMLERKKGIAAGEIISKATAKLIGAKKGKGKIFVPPSAEDFDGLLYNFIGTGKQGDADMAFFDEKLLKPLARANFNLNKERQLIKQSYHNLIQNNKGILKKLRKESDYRFYDNDAAVRVYMWTKLGYEIPGINAKDKKGLINAVIQDKQLLDYAEQLINVPNKKESWLQPEDDWTASTIEMDLQEILSKIGRARIFEEYITNANIIFSKDNINKIEAAYGPSLRNALEDMLYRIEKGRARNEGTNKMANAYLNWVRGSVATTMFFNVRSALLQQLSIVNFTNWEDNNIYAQGKFIAGSPTEYAKYWVSIFNSDWMKERRQGLKTDINESELIAKLEGTKNKNKALLSYILEKGFSLTKYGDNIAIATGGAPFLYNREQKYIKEGMTEAKAKEQAFLDFQEIAERTQQSSRQDLLSNQQVSVVGRLFLAFQNTTMQMTRLQKKAALDLIYRRGSTKANIARLVYYGTIQNTIFSFLQSALFASFFSNDDDEDDELKINDKTIRAINTVLDSSLRGSGIGGAALATLKNALIVFMRENDKGFTGQNGKVILELLNISPAVGIKARKIYGAMENYKFNKKILDQIGYDNPNHPYYGIAGNLTSAAFNIPLDRIVTKASNIKAMTQSDAEAWQRTALFMGYNSWDLGLKDPEIEKAKAKSKFKSKIIKPKSSSRKTPRSSRSSGRKSSR